jgi:serine/threonine protein kinase
MNEARAITELRRAGNHPNIILILDQGWLSLFGSPSGCYFIDMEFCELTLHKYIYAVSGRDIVARGEENLENNPVFVPRESCVNLRLQNVWTIMSHIAAGTEFMHKHGQVHRDLKPRNGMNLL